MKVLVAYLSLTGNTRKIAEAIFQAIHCEKKLAVFGEISDVSPFDIIFVGFPIHGFGQPATAAVNFLREYCPGKKVALFITHAAPEASPYVPPWLEACKMAAEAAHLVGIGDFQGQIALEKVDEALQKNDPALLEMIKNVVHSSLGQPDAERLQRARLFAATIMDACAGQAN